MPVKQRNKVRPTPYRVLRRRGRNSGKWRTVYQGENSTRAERCYERIAAQLRQGVVRLVVQDPAASDGECVLRERDDRWRVLCLDCGKDTIVAAEYSMLHDALWAQIHPPMKGMLCLDCAEQRLGRRLTRADFAAVPVNAGRRIQARYGCS